MRHIQEQSIHHDFIKSAIPAWFTHAVPQRVRALKDTLSSIPEWTKKASAIEHVALKRATEACWRAQSDVDQMLRELRDIYAFAQPLLSQALKDQYGVEVDVRETFLKLYSPVKLSPWVMNVTGGVSSRTVSLLDAALRNFAIGEVLLADSQFITRPDERGQFEIKNIRTQMSIEQFKTLCRELDIGARYSQYLEDYLRPTDGLVQAVLQSTIIESQQTALNAAAHLALMKGDLSRDGFLVVQGVLKGGKGLKLDGIPVRHYHLTMLDTRLKGIVLIAPDLDVPYGGTRRVIAYVPHDPEHPLKEYPSLVALSRELIRQLRGADQAASGLRYQQFFSRFVDHQQRGHFFATLNQQLEQPDNPRVRFDVMRFERDTEHRFKGDLWVYLYQQQQNKILNDARALVISTADADSEERWAWVANLQKILSDIFNVALLVVTPFVPGLGEVMMVYMVYQLVSEVVEGVVDLAEGMYLEAAGHLIDFTESLIQLGTFAVGMQIAGGTLVPKLSSFIEGTRPVTLSDGSQRLWGQDLEPYVQTDPGLSADSKPDSAGLHQHAGQPVLRVDTRHFKLRKDPQTNQHRVQHPARPQAYEPLVNSNGDGAFVIEGEQPHLWDDKTLMTRLGPSMGGLPDAYSDIRTVSRTDTNAIRRMYTDNERPLPSLSDTAIRFRIDRDIQTFIEQIGSDHPQDYLQADPVLQFQLLDGVWPGRGMALVGADGEILQVIGDAQAPPVRIDPKQLIDGDLMKTLLSHLDNNETKALMNVEFGEPLSAPDVNAKRMRTELARLAQRRRTSLFSAEYSRTEAARHSASGEVRMLQEKVPGLPGAVAQEVLSVATPAELQAIKGGQWPPRLENLARWALQDVRVCRAYEGLYLDSVDNPDTRRLALHSLENLPGWNPDVRIEVVRFDYRGRVLDSIGRSDAPIRRTLVEREDLTFQSHDDEGNVLHSGADFYTAILQALPDAERIGLNIHIGEGPKLKRAVREHALKSYRLLRVLSDLPVLEPLTFDPQVMRLRGGAPTAGDEVADLLHIDTLYPELVAGAFHPSVSRYERFDYLRGLKLMHRSCPDVYFDALWQALNKANVAGDAQANVSVVRSIEALPDLEKIMLPEQFDALVERLFTKDGLIPLTESELNLGSNARNLQRTGRLDEYQALSRNVRDNTAPASEPLADLRNYRETLFTDVVTPDEPVGVSPQIMADLQLAQRAIYRAKELIPLSGNQLPSLWEKGGSAIAKIKGLRELNLEEGGFTAKLSIAEAASKAIAIKGGNCSENSKVTFSILASQPRTSRIHIVRATRFDHQYVVIGDDLLNPDQLVVADSWPEFPSAHLASNGYFQFELPAVATLEPGPAVAAYSFINDAPPGQAALPDVTEANTYRQIKINKLYKSGAYAQFTSLKALGGTYSVPGGTPVSFERLPASVINRRIDAYHGYREAFKAFLETSEDTE
ncbi:NEL domain-containing protein [Pseudomonas sp. IT-P253]|uniref:dermonecrotic toxin domain-containing protein n=1 Tax=Pseudomonas sp. IT-P253 TaxID=3026455 RepID=UPI0039DF6898